MKSLDSDPSNTNMRLSRSVALLRQVGDDELDNKAILEQALGDAEMVVKSRPEWFKGWAAKARAQMLLGQHCV